MLGMRAVLFEKTKIFASQQGTSSEKKSQHMEPPYSRNGAFKIRNLSFFYMIFFHNRKFIVVLGGWFHVLVLKFGRADDTCLFCSDY